MDFKFLSNVLYDYIIFDIFDYILGPVGRFAHLGLRNTYFQSLVVFI